MNEIDPLGIIKYSSHDTHTPTPDAAFIVQDTEAFDHCDWIPEEIRTEADHETKVILLTEFLRALNKAHVRLIEKDLARGKKLDTQAFADQQRGVIDYVGDTASDLAKEKLQAIERARELAFAHVALEKATAERGTHQLTGLLNEKGIEKIFTKEIKAMEKDTTRGHMVVVRFDGDNFKIVNDTHGHAAGDIVLKGIAQALQESSRPGDYPLHFSGDEYGILLTDVHPGEGKTLEQTVHDIIARQVEAVERVIRPDGQIQRISPGFVILNPGDQGHFSEYDEQADGAANESKKLKYDRDSNHIAGTARIINYANMGEEQAQRLSPGERHVSSIKAATERHRNALKLELEQRRNQGTITPEEIKKIEEAEAAYLKQIKTTIDSTPPGSIPAEIDPPKEEKAPFEVSQS